LNFREANWICRCELSKSISQLNGAVSRRMIINTRFTVTLWQASAVLLFFTSVTLGLFQKTAWCFSFLVVCVFLCFCRGLTNLNIKFPKWIQCQRGNVAFGAKRVFAIYLLNTNTDMRSFKNSAFQTIKSHSSFIIVKYLSWKHLRGGSERVYSSMLWYMRLQVSLRRAVRVCL